MNTNDINCAHACKNTCAMLRKAMEHEATLIRFYEDLGSVCDYPDIHAFFADAVNRHRKLVEDIRGKLDEMEARGKVMDDVISSFDPAGV